ncbi:MAG: DUF131 domain-containing protein [Halobacteriota archaeon]
MKLITLGFMLVCIGILIIFVGMLKIVYQTGKTREMEKPDVRGGGIIMIGPIPIIFGTDVGVLKVVMIFAVVLMLLATILFFLQPL